MRISCEIGGYTYIGHNIWNGLCLRCGKTSNDASEFDLIRAWYSVFGEKAVTPDMVNEMIGDGRLPNIRMRRAGETTADTGQILKALTNGMVVMEDGVTIVDVIALPDGSFRTERRREDARA